ncbi:phosphatidylinositol 4-phosphate 3-kinase C2 domain-containing subunit beta-like [Etheostoma cragini]|uniref:phosphatidylinositol 4-phosphate 3-kinase C2 domain-containing subunit beta-like n=1 Tax=Etheostoma cragini TaxID=417921 RepID=UPI00155E90E4|nr:phosphatidylinositol 4-phosphate 3-kinase C2 domain-containing subunit beta-like [Etheostoma cragini]
MSAPQTQQESSEAGWPGLEALGLSQKELVLAEALQMEYDALSRHKKDQSGTEPDPTRSRAPSQTRSKTPNPTIERPRPRPSVPAPPGGSLLRGLSGSDPSLNQNQPGGSQSPPSIPARVLPPRGGFLTESLYILEGPELGKIRPGSSLGSGSGFPPKGFPCFPDDVPPALPPRNPLPLPSENPFLPPRGSNAPRDVNLFTPDLDPPKVSASELNYDNINDSLSRLNETRTGPRGRRANAAGDQSGKPVARSKTLPPQVPPRTYIPVAKSNKNQRRVSADPVSLGSRANGFGYELFQVSEERDEEVAAFCHMLDV